jgi:putative zinc finger/helix-turn-helix YgiT family protein
MDEWKMSKCVQCGSTTLRAAKSLERMTVSGVEFTAELPATKCTKCGEVYFTGNAIGAMELAIAAELSKLGQRTPEAFKFMRKALGLRAVDLAELLEVTSDTVSRWERGAVSIDQAAFAVLGALVSERRQGSTEMLDRLKAVRDAKAPTKPVRVVAA